MSQLIPIRVSQFPEILSSSIRADDMFHYIAKDGILGGYKSRTLRMSEFLKFVSVGNITIIENSADQAATASYLINNQGFICSADTASMHVAYADRAEFVDRVDWYSIENKPSMVLTSQTSSMFVYQSQRTNYVRWADIDGKPLFSETGSYDLGSYLLVKDFNPYTASVQSTLDNLNSTVNAVSFATAENTSLFISFQTQYSNDISVVDSRLHSLEVFTSSVQPYILQASESMLFVSHSMLSETASFAVNASEAVYSFFSETAQMAMDSINSDNITFTDTPTGSMDSIGSHGSFAIDNSFLYVKSGSLWRRTVLSTF